MTLPRLVVVLAAIHAARAQSACTLRLEDVNIPVHASSCPGARSTWARPARRPGAVATRAGQHPGQAPRTATWVPSRGTAPREEPVRDYFLKRQLPLRGVHTARIPDRPDPARGDRPRRGPAAPVHDLRDARLHRLRLHRRPSTDPVRPGVNAELMSDRAWSRCSVRFLST